MLVRSILRLWAVIALALLAACGAGLPSGGAPAASAPASGPQPTVPPPAAGAGLPEGRTPDGYHMLGRADAPVTLVMYSDFL